MRTSGIPAKVILVLAIFIVLHLRQAYGANVSIAQPFNDTLLCKGGSFNLSLNFGNLLGYYDDTNNFYVELSDASGNFFSPVIIGTSMGSSAPFITCYLNSSTSIGTGYRVRVRTTAPAEITNDDGKNIRISPYPVFSMGSNAPICAGKMLSLTSALNAPALSPVSYSWNGPSGFVSSLQSPSIGISALTDSGYYKLSVTHYGCVVRDSVFVRIIASPTKMNIRSNSPVCGGDELAILTDCSTCLLPGVMCSYSMKLPGGGILANNNLLVKNVTAANAGKYLISISVLGCTITDSVIADVKPRPDSPWHYTNSPVCLGDSLRLFAGANIPGISYVWKGPGGFTSNSATAIVPHVGYANAGIYSVTTLLQGCPSPVGRDTVIVGTPLNRPSIKGKTTICEGDSLMLSATASITQGSFDWYYNHTFFHTANPLFIQHMPLSASGVYSVVQKFMGCVSPADSVYVTVPDVPNPNVSINNPVCFDQALKLDMDSVPNAIYFWKGPAHTFAGREATIPNTVFADSGKYVAIVSIDGCMDSTVNVIHVLPLPELTFVSSNTPVCENDMLELFATSNIDTGGFAWVGPDGFNSNQQHIHTVVRLKDSGIYMVQAVAGICRSYPDSIRVEVKRSPDSVTVTTEHSLEYGAVLHLLAYCPTPEVTYRWTGPADFFSTTQNNIINNVTPSMAGDYIAIATGTNGCSSRGYSSVVIHPIDQSEYTVYPNPNNGRFKVYGELNANADISFEIFNSIGRSVYKGNVASYKNSFRLDIDLGDVAGGVYYMHLVNSNKHDNETLIISVDR